MPDGTVLVHDDNLGKAQRERDWEMQRPHIDIRVAGRTHDEVRRLGAEWLEIEVIHD